MSDLVDLEPTSRRCAGLELSGDHQTIRNLTFERMSWTSLQIIGRRSDAGQLLPATTGGHLIEGNTFARRTGYGSCTISPDDDKQVQLLADDEPVTWQFIAKDGADMSPHQVRMQPADLRIHVGETYDFRWVPERAGEYVLRITTTFDRGVPAFPRDAPPPHTWWRSRYG